MTPAEGVKRAAQALSLLWPFAVIAAVSFGRMSLLLAAGLPLFAFQAIFTLRYLRTLKEPLASCFIY